METSVWVPLVLTSLTTLLASTGFWAWVMRRTTIRTETDKLLRGLAYDKIVTMGMSYISRGWLTQDEYEEYRRYLYDPYKAMGGNGITDRIMAEVQSLPLRPRNMFVEVVHQVRNERETNESIAERGPIN